MCRAEATVRDGLVLKWCYDCGYYTWCRHEDGFVCTSCGNRVRDWLAKLLYEQGGKTNGEVQRA